MSRSLVAKASERDLSRLHPSIPDSHALLIEETHLLRDHHEHRLGIAPPSLNLSAAFLIRRPVISAAGQSKRQNCGPDEESQHLRVDFGHTFPLILY